MFLLRYRRGNIVTHLRTSVAPHEIITAPCDARIQPVNILAPWWDFGGQAFQEAVQLLNQSLDFAIVGDSVRQVERLRDSRLQAARACRANCRRDVQSRLIRRQCHGVDMVGRGRSEATLDT
jgi:hypothetical protein